MEKVVIGNATLYLGDCLEVLPTLRDVDALVSDPPYGISLNYHHGRGAGVKRDQRIAGDACQTTGKHVIEWAEALDLAMVLFASPWKQWPGTWSSMVVWDKGGAVGAGGNAAMSTKRTWELIQARNNPARNNRPDSVWREHITPASLSSHPCAKPVPLMERIVSHFTDGTVIDPFMGSGSTGVACMRLNRKFVGIEIERRYFDMAYERIENEQRQARLAI